MKKIKLSLISFFTSLILLTGCLVDIPAKRSDGPSFIIYGKVINEKTGDPISKAVISDGFLTTLTNQKGEYRFETFPGASHVYISVPELYEIPMKGGMPQIFETIGVVKDSLKINFNLTPLKNGVEKDFTLLAVADPQVQNAKHLNRLNTEAITDIKKEIKNHKNIYGLTLGDIAFDSLAMLSDLKQSFISTTIPFFHTIGNHDFSSNIYDPNSASEKFVSAFGPLDFSFNRGDAHIVVMNNVFNYDVVSYNFGFSRDQIKWLESDLSYVSKNKMLIVCVHVPVTLTSTMERKTEFMDLISSFNEVHIFSGHWHANRNNVNGNIYEHITGSAGGMWWSSNINKCGAPNGYGVYEISGNKMKNWYYKSVNYDKNYQMIKLDPYTFNDKDGYVIVNVWNADDKWVVEMYEDGINRGRMEQFVDYAPEVFALNKSKNISEGTNWYMKTNHLYRMKPLNKDASIVIKATDRFGNVYKQDVSLKGLSSLTTYK